MHEGDSVTLRCEVTGSTEGWRFHWYRVDSAVKQTLVYSNGDSYTLVPVAVRHTGLYMCRAERGEPPYYTKNSKLQPVWVMGKATIQVQQINGTCSCGRFGFVFIVDLNWADMHSNFDGHGCVCGF